MEFRIRPTSRRVGAGLLLALVAGGGLAACSSGAPANSITLYNGQHVQTTDALVAAFEHQTGISVRIHSDDESVLADQIVTEGSNSPADVIFTENTPALEFLQSKHLLAALGAGAGATTQPRYDSDDGDWVGISARVSVLVYNPSLIKPSALPTSVLRLADPRYRGLLALAPGETDFQPIVTSVLRAEGKAATLRWLGGLKANSAGHLYPDNETITSEVNSGQVAMGVINQYYWYRLRSQIGARAMHSAITTFAPRDPGYVIDVSGAGVLRASTHRADATRFVQFLASRAAQEIIAGSDSYEYPIDAGVTRTGETPFAELRPAPVSLAELGDGSTAVALLQQVQLL
ncbi:MAG TPA: extracellular solute-binding protein [Acidimicrobiia bacterium]|nr:extracellular solute-binding protein [Acidimicrobiia bacterium]